MVNTEAMWDQQAEEALLAACISSKDARIIARRTLSADDFYRPLHELLFTVMGELDRDAGQGADPVDLHTVTTAAMRHREGRGAAEVVLALPMATTVSTNARAYATTVHEFAVRRRVAAAALSIGQDAYDRSVPVESLTARAVTQLQNVRDHGDESEHDALTLEEVLALPPDSRPWVIPDLLRARDRLMITGGEGGGKSTFSRQLGIMTAAGIHPLNESMIPAQRVLFIDAENSREQVAEEARPLFDWLRRNAPDAYNPGRNVVMRNTGRLNLHTSREVDRIHSLIDDFNPALVIMGPIYKMTPGALNTDDDATRFLAVLETITERGCALILEAHAGHARVGHGRTEQRDLRPRGSSALLGWPEFGFGLRPVADAPGVVDLERWRGDRSQRAWPSRLQRAGGRRYVEGHPGHSRDAAEPPEPDDPQGSLYG